MTGHSPTSGSTEAIVMVKAAPQVDRRHGETVCCAGIDLYGNWLRLYPVSFRTLEQSKKFGRWDRIKFNWRIPNDDKRVESRRVDQQSIEIVGQLKKSERAGFLAKAVVTSLVREREAGRSFALLKPRNSCIQDREKECRRDQDRKRVVRIDPRAGRPLRKASNEQLQSLPVQFQIPISR